MVRFATETSVPGALNFGTATLEPSLQVSLTPVWKSKWSSMTPSTSNSDRRHVMSQGEGTASRVTRRQNQALSNILKALSSATNENETSKRRQSAELTMRKPTAPQPPRSQEAYKMATIPSTKENFPPQALTDIGRKLEESMENLQSKPPAEEALSETRPSIMEHHEAPQQHSRTASGVKVRVALPHTPPKSVDQGTRTPGSSPRHSSSPPGDKSAGTNFGSPTYRNFESNPSLKNGHAADLEQRVKGKVSVNTPERPTSENKPTWASVATPENLRKPVTLTPTVNVQASGQGEVVEIGSTGSSTSSLIPMAPATPITANNTGPTKGSQKTRAKGKQPETIKKSQPASAPRNLPTKAGEGSGWKRQTSQLAPDRVGSQSHQPGQGFAKTASKGRQNQDKGTSDRVPLPKSQKEKETWAEAAMSAMRKDKKVEENGKGTSVDIPRQQIADLATSKHTRGLSGGHCGFQVLSTGSDAESGHEESHVEVKGTDVSIQIITSKGEAPLPVQADRSRGAGSQQSDAISKRKGQLNEGPHSAKRTNGSNEKAPSETTATHGRKTHGRQSYRDDAGGSLRVKKNREKRALGTGGSATEQLPGTTPPSSDFASEPPVRNTSQKSLESESDAQKVISLSEENHAEMVKPPDQSPKTSKKALNPEAEEFTSSSPVALTPSESPQSPKSASSHTIDHSDSVDEFVPAEEHFSAEGRDGAGTDSQDATEVKPKTSKGKKKPQIVDKAKQTETQVGEAPAPSTPSKNKNKKKPRKKKKAPIQQPTLSKKEYMDNFPALPPSNSSASQATPPVAKIVEPTKEDAASDSSYTTA